MTTTASGVQWSLSDNITAFNPGSGGLGFTEAEFADMAAGLDAFDGAFVIRINGTHFAAPAANSALGGNLFTSGSANYAGLASQVEFKFDAARPLVRALYSFSNPSQAPINASFSWEVNLGSDANTVVRGTSEDSPMTALNRWLVTSDSGQGDTVVTLARWGLNAPHKPDGTPNVPGDPLARRDLLADVYNVSVQPGQTVRLMMFGVLSPITDGVVSAAEKAGEEAAIFNDYTAMAQAGFFAGLPNFNEIINWAVPEPNVITLLIVGLGTFWLRHRRR